MIESLVSLAEPVLIFLKNMVKFTKQMFYPLDFGISGKFAFVFNTEINNMQLLPTEI